MIVSFQNNKISLHGAKLRLLRYYDIATKEEKEKGRLWYKEANSYCQKLSKKHKVPLIQICGILAALSPQMMWNRNKLITEKFLIGEQYLGVPEMRIKKCNIILTTENKNVILETLSKGGKFLKTRNFFKNVYEPSQVNGVTVDRHAIAAIIQNNKKTKALSSIALTTNQYLFFSNCYVKTAEKVNLKPHELQATIWETYRRLRK